MRSYASFMERSFSFTLASHCRVYIFLATALVIKISFANHVQFLLLTLDTFFQCIMLIYLNFFVIIFFKWFFIVVLYIFSFDANRCKG